MHRVIINTNHKRYEGNLIGKEGVVLNITQNGWVKLQASSQTSTGTCRATVIATMLDLLLNHAMAGQQQHLALCYHLHSSQVMVIILCRVCGTCRLDRHGRLRLV